MQSANLKRLAFNHFGSTVLVFAILVSAVTAMITLSLTGDLPGIGGDGSAQVADRSVTTSVAAADAERRQLGPEWIGFSEMRQSLALPEANTARVTGDKYDYLLRDMYALTEAAPQVIPNYRLLDWNVLPGDDVRHSSPTYDDYHFLDLNVLPGDDVQLPPVGEDGKPY